MKIYTDESANPSSVANVSVPRVNITRANIAGLNTTHGFTLIEVMLAMAITTFIAMLAYSGLSTSMTAAEQHGEQAQRIANIQLPLTVMERDIRHAVNRPVIDEYGESLPAMMGGALEDYPLILTRRGWNNPRGLSRGELQRVRYILQGEELWRESWSVLDRVSQEEGMQRTLLLSGVTNFELAFLDGEANGASQSPIGGEWINEWDSRNNLPLALQIKLEVEKFGELNRVFSIPSE